MIAKTMDECSKRGAFVDERCSIHVHLLASYLSPGFDESDNGSSYIRNEVTELEKPMPEVIVANFHQLIRRYHCALIWLSAAGESHDQLTRWEKFRKSVLPYSAIRQRMGTLVSSVGSASKSKRKYAMMNYEQMQFNAAGDVSRLHVEGRYMDGNLSPATVTAHACLLYGIMLKAVEISRYGVLQSGNKGYMDLQNEMYKSLCNRDGPWDGPRFSDTSNIGPYLADLRRQSKQLVRLVKSTLGEQTPADEILNKLAEKPLAYSLMEKKTWEQIEEWLMPESEDLGEVEDSIIQFIELGAISDCADADEWVETAAYQMASTYKGQEKPPTKESLQAYVTQLTLRRRIHWSKDIGGFVGSR
jgi:hypothetical protein